LRDGGHEREMDPHVLLRDIVDERRRRETQRGLRQRDRKSFVQARNTPHPQPFSPRSGEKGAIPPHLARMGEGGRRWGPAAVIGFMTHPQNRHPLRNDVVGAPGPLPQGDGRPVQIDRVVI
jgi:hypothetical protein